MKTEISFEWGIEIKDESGDVIDNHFEDKLSMLSILNVNEDLVLIRNEGNEREGLTDRFWAYVKNGNLPDFFQNAAGDTIGISVPKKFKNELKQYQMKAIDTDTYTRVIPRDFFNEAKLLKCMGQLALKILDNACPENLNIVIEETGEPFQIELTDEGSLTIANYPAFKTTYNSKSAFPFFCEVDYTDYEVFDDNGNFTEEFISIPL